MTKVNLDNSLWRERKSPKNEQRRPDGLMTTANQPILLISVWAIALALAAAGCKSSPVPPLTQSGLPEVELSAQTKVNTVQGIVGEFFRGRGYVEARSQHLYEMVFDKPTQSGRDRRALRVRLRLHKQLDESWRLVGTPLGVDGWRTDLESEAMLMEGANQIQSFLLEIKSRIESVP